MPGAFHTEVVEQSQNQFRVYLLDIHWKNATVNSSFVKAKVMGKKQSSAKCEIQSDFYLCSFEKGIKLDHGQLIIEAQREGLKGTPISYSLPLKLEQSPHGAH